jgi:hypothetical protein
VEFGAGALKAGAIIGDGGVAAAIAFGLSDDIAGLWAGLVALCLLRFGKSSNRSGWMLPQIVSALTPIWRLSRLTRETVYWPRL